MDKVREQARRRTMLGWCTLAITCTSFTNSCLSCRDFSDSCFIDTSVPSCRTPCSRHKWIQIGESLFVSPIFVWLKFLHERVPFVWQTDRIYGCNKCGSLPCTWHQMPLPQFCFLCGSSLLLSSALHTVWHNWFVVDADQKDLLSMSQTIIRLS